MLRNAKIAGLVVLAGLLALTACSAGSGTPTPDANTVYTQVASTVQSELTQSAALTPSATATVEPTATETPAPTVAATSSTPAGTATSAATGTRAPSPDRGEYIGQSITDNTKFDPGQTFTMTWTVKNAGTTTWTTAYCFRFFSGEQLGAPATIQMPKEVKPGDTVELSVPMTAPSKNGTLLSTWVLTNKDGVNFGSVYLQILVGDAPAPTNTSAPIAQPTATAAS